MKKLKVFLCVCTVLILAVIGILIFSNRENNNIGKYSKSSSSNTCSEEGYFYIGDDMLIHFVSAVTNEDMIFCFDPVCKHDAVSEDSECIAACGNQRAFIHYHDKSIYVFNRVDLEEHKVYRIDINSGTKEPVATLPFNIQGNQIIFDGDYAYYQAMVFVLDEDGQEEYTYYDLIELNITDGSYRLLLDLKENVIFRAFDVCDRKMFAMKLEGDTEAALYYVDLDTLDARVVATQNELYNGDSYIGMYDGESYYYCNSNSHEVGIRNVITDECRVLYEYGESEEMRGLSAGRNKLYCKTVSTDGKSKFFLYDVNDDDKYDFTDRMGSYDVKLYSPYMEMFVLEPEGNSDKGNYIVVKESELKDNFVLSTEKTSQETQVAENNTGDDTDVAEGERGKEKIVGIIGEGDAKRLGVSKTLVWIIPDGVRPKEATVNKLNELLVNRYGCDFVVEFHQYDMSMNFKSDNYKFADMVKDMRELGHQADILHSGNFFDYDGFVDEGIYIPLTEYFATEEGQKLYNAYSPEVWAKTVREGHSYGYTSRIYPAGRAILLCNEAVMKQYGITVPDGDISFYDIGKYLEVADMSKETLENKAILLSCSTDALLLMEGYQQFETLSEGIFFKDNGNGGWMAVNPADEDEFVRLAKTVREYADKGWYVNVSDKEKTIIDNDDSYIELNPVGRYAFRYYYGSFVEISCENNKLSETACFGGTNYELVTTEVTILDEAYCGIEPISNMINGVASWSEYKDEALKLITLIQTEAELSNLLEYGVEGEDYKYEDGLITSLKSGKTIRTGITDLSNTNLLHSIHFEPEDKLAYSKEISANYKVGPTLMYDFDMSAYDEQLTAISEIYRVYLKELFMGYCTDVETTIEAMKKELAAAGIDEVVAEINRQMEQH